ncbi:uncharacterized protein [Typha latifolia]|uniref:uncharacterized protein n=1 Tax=Typha latifolia TaxID=4733 RepID=UPI003C2BE3EA
MILERIITVEYLQPSMSHELLGKFPDPSPFDFDYTQSSIWSPLLPRGRHGLPLLSSKKQWKVKSMLFKKKNKKQLHARKLDFSPIPSPKLGLKKLLKAAARRFKIRGKSSSWQMMLPTS